MWPFSKKPDPQAAELAAKAALECQTTDIEAKCSKAGRDLSEVLESTATVLLLFGFVDYYFITNGVKNRKQRVHLAINVFRSVFGDTQGIRMFGALGSALRDQDSERWCQEGFNAALHSESDELRLLENYFQGVLGSK